MNSSPNTAIQGPRFRVPLTCVLHVVLAVGLIVHCAAYAHAQFSLEPQAQTPEEFDAYLNLSQLKTPEAFFIETEKFERKWPQSEFLRLVYRRQLDLYKSIGDSKDAVAAGEKTLRLTPDNLDVMAELAYLIADSQSNAQLSQARTYGQHVLDLVGTIQIPRSISPLEWHGIRAALECKAHTALGLVAFKSDQLEQSMREFELALKADAGQESTLLYRLGVVYRLTGRKDQARDTLMRAADSKEPDIRQRALQEMQKLGPSR